MMEILIYEIAQLNIVDACAVILAKAGIQSFQCVPGSSLRRGDETG